MRHKSRTCLLVLLLSLASFPATLRALAPDEQAYRLTMEGQALTPKQAQGLEDALVKQPDELAARTKLLGYSFLLRRQPGQDADAFRRHVVWIIRNHPEAGVAGMPQAQPNRILESATYKEARELWLEKIQGDAPATAVLANAAAFFLLYERAKSEELLKKLQAKEPDNPEWPERLGHLYELDVMNISGAPDAKIAKRALEAYEQAIPSADPTRRRLLLLEAAKVAVQAGELKKARDYAGKVLDGAVEVEANRDWNYGNAVHHGNLVLGHVALIEGDLDAAGRFLVKAGKTPGSPQLNSFGPNMRLALELLKKGKKEVVIEYLKLCGKFWNRATTDAWIAQIEKGETPNFAGNLRH